MVGLIHTTWKGAPRRIRWPWLEVQATLLQQMHGQQLTSAASQFTRQMVCQLKLPPFAKRSSRLYCCSCSDYQASQSGHSLRNSKMLDNRGCHLAIVVSWAPSNGAGAVLALHESLSTAAPMLSNVLPVLSNPLPMLSRCLRCFVLHFLQCIHRVCLLSMRFSWCYPMLSRPLPLLSRLICCPVSHFLLCFDGLCLLWMKAP